MSKEFTNGKFITLISELAQDLADYHGSDLTEEDFKDYNKFQEIMACVTDLTYIYIQGLKMFIWAEYAGIIDELEDQAHQELEDQQLWEIRFVAADVQSSALEAMNGGEAHV